MAVNITRSRVTAADDYSRIPDAQLEALEHAGEVLGVPAVTEYQSDRECLWILTAPKVAWRSPKQFLEVVVDIQLLKDGLDEGTGPAEGLSRGDCSKECRGAGVATPTSRALGTGGTPPGPESRLRA